MNTLEDIFNARRDTRHFTNEPVPGEVLEKALKAGHTAPSVGLSDATRYYVIKSLAVKQEVKKLFEGYNQKACDQIEEESKKAAYKALKLEAILDAPIGLVVCYDRSVLNDFTIGTVASNDTIKFSAVCAVQNIWLSLTEQGYSMGWVSIINYYQFKKVLALPDEIEPLGYFCIGKPATNYDNQPMLHQLGWKSKVSNPTVSEIKVANRTEDEIDPRAFSNNFSVPDDVSQQLASLINNKTKPTGSLGVLEELAQHIGEVLRTTTPKLKKPYIVLFAADHGIAQHGVSAYPQEVTRQMVCNFLEGGAAINVFCKQHDLLLKIVDAGVNYDFAPQLNVIHNKIGRGTQSFLNGPAMSLSELKLCLQKGAEVVQAIYNEGCNTIGFGEMGIGNTSSASALMSVLCNIPIENCIGKGTGVNDEQLVKKQQILQTAIKNYNGDKGDLQLMAHFGGFEILQIAGGMLQAKRNNMLIFVDGFICTVAFLCAYKISPAVKDNAIFSHQSGEHGHKQLFEYLRAEPLLKLKMRLGEGTGCAVAFPLLQSAVAFLNEMATFENASVSTK